MLSETMCPADPCPMCPQNGCGYPISGCRYLGCDNPKCRKNHTVQGVELKHKPASQFEFFEKFDTQEMPWRPSRGIASPTYGYEAPYRPLRHFFPGDSIKQNTLKCNAIPTQDQPWRAHRKCFPKQTGAHSDDPRRHRKYLVPAVAGMQTGAVPRRVSSQCYDCSSQRSSQKEWKPSRHQSGKAGSETTQQDYHPHRRHIPKCGSTATIRHPKKAPGFYKRNEGEWLPPFRASTPEFASQQSPGCDTLWQCPKIGKKAAPDCRRQGEWQPDFRSKNSQSTPSTPNSRPQGLKHIHIRPDEWFPPWKQHQHQHQQQCDFDDSWCDPLVQRNATINEDANCTHYLDDDDDKKGEYSLQERPAESTEEESGEGEGSDQRGKEEDSSSSKEFHTSCESSRDEPRAGKSPPDCWSSPDDDLL